MQIFQSWTELGRIAATAVLTYLFIIFAVRITGKRSTSKMNNYDWIVTVAMGSIAGSIVLLKDVVLLDGFVAVGTLLVLQFLSTKLSVHYSSVRKLLTAAPTLLYYRDEFLDDALKRERVTRDEILSAARQQGYNGLDTVIAVILEPSAELSFLERSTAEESPTLDEVRSFL